MAEKLTILAARSLAPGGILRDAEVRGLELWAKAGGKYWFFYHRLPTGERRRPKIGEYPTLGIEAAREVAKAMATEVAKGNDPSGARQAFRDAPTMDDLFEAYLSARADKRTIDQDERNWRVHLTARVGKIKAEAFALADADRALAAIARPKVETVKLAKAIGGRTTRKMQRGGKIAANRCRALLSGLLKYAERGDVNARPRGSNFIMADTKLNPERKRRRHVKKDEFPRIWAALREHAPDYPQEVAALWASLYSGTRVSELLDCKRVWLAGAVVRLPVHKTMEKRGDDRIIRLPSQALDLIAGIPPGPDGLLFGPGLDRFRVGRVWGLIREAAGCPDVQPRDIRRTFASVGRTSGLALGQVASLLGHDGDEKTTAGYAYIWDDAAASMVQAIADQMDELAKGSE